MKPATMAGQLGSPYLLLLVWVIAGIVSMFGAMAYAELGTMFPETGGQLIYLNKSFGDFVGFLYGWSSIMVVNSAAIAAIAFVCAEYTGYFINLPHFNPATEKSILIHIPMIGDILPLQNFGVKFLAITIIGGLTIVNYVSVRSGNAIQFIATVVKTFAIFILVVGILFSGKGSLNNFITNSSSFHLHGWSLFAAFMAATTGAFSAYDGWNNLSMVAGEIKDPNKNITKSLLSGLTICILVYVLITLSYMYVLPIDVMAKSPLVASEATEKVLGTIGATIIAMLIAVSTFGATNINLLACSRVVFAMATSGIFFLWAGKVHPKYNTPGNACIILGAWSCLLVLSGSFDILADMFVFMSWVFYGLVVTGVFILRKKMPDVNRPYKVWGYPWLPAIFILFTAIYVGTTLYNDITNYRTGKSPIINSVFGLILTGVGVPLYFYFKRNTQISRIKTDSTD